MVSSQSLQNLHTDSFATSKYVNPTLFWVALSIWSEPCGMRGLGPTWGPVLEAGPKNSTPSAHQSITCQSNAHPGKAGSFYNSWSKENEYDAPTFMPPQTTHTVECLCLWLESCQPCAAPSWLYRSEALRGSYLCL